MVPHCIATSGPELKLGRELTWSEHLLCLGQWCPLASDSTMAITHVGKDLYQLFNLTLALRQVSFVVSGLTDIRGLVPLVNSEINTLLCLFFRNAGFWATTIVYPCLVMFLCVFPRSCIAWGGFWAVLLRDFLSSCHFGCTRVHFLNFE